MYDQINDAARFDDSPSGWHARYMVELEAAKKHLEDWRPKAQATIDRFLDKRDAVADPQTNRRFNLFTSSTQTLRAMLYGKVPSVEVSRRFGDAKDDVARVAAEIMQRCLNSDIERDGDGFRSAIGSALDDRLLPGMGQVRLRYTVETEERTVPPVMGPMPGVMSDPSMGSPMVELAPGYTETVKAFEDAETDYAHWDDFLFSPCRTWDECRIVFFKTPMSREDLKRRFGEEVGAVIPLDNSGAYGESAEKKQIDDVWGRATIWEAWDKDRRKAVWFCEGYAQILDERDDPLGLDGFFPCPRPLIANATTSSLVPVPDYYFAQDQYRELDEVTSRISELQKAIAVKGVGDSGSSQLKELIKGGENEIVLVDNFAMLAERGGIKGVVDWFPLEQVIKTIRELENRQDRLVQQLYQITGLSDIIRGQATNSATATEQSIKAKFASVRLQALQDEVAEFASGAQKIRAEIIVKHFDDETILKRANYVGGQDQELVGPALQLLRDQFASFRIQIKPENINLSDAAALKSERMEALQMVGGFLANTAQLAQMNPKAAPLLTEMLTWAFAGFKGSSTIEGSLDRYAAEQAAQAAQPPTARPPPPQVVVEKMKQEGAARQTQADLQAELIKTDAQTKAEVTKQRAQLEADLTMKREEEAVAARAEARAAGMAAVEAFTRGGV